jgi:hypothetical protein
MAEGARAIPQPQFDEPRDFKKLITDIVQDITRIFRAEVQLARAEISEKVSSAGSAAGAMAVAAVTGLLAAGSIVAAGIAALALVFPLWAAALIMGVLLLIVAGIAYASGRVKLKRVAPTPQRTVQTIKDNIEWARQRA